MVDKLQAEVEVKGSDQGLNKVTDSLAEISDLARDAAQNLTQLARVSDKAEKSLAGIAKGAGDASKSAKGIGDIAAQADRAVKSSRELGKSFADLQTFTPYYAGRNFKMTTEELVRQIRTVGALRDQYEALKKTQAGLSTDAGRNGSYVPNAAKRAFQADQYNLANNPISAKDFTSKAAAEAAGYFDTAAKSVNNFGGALRTSLGDIEVTNDKLAGTRYALHDVSTTAGIAGAAMLAATALIVKAGMDYETAVASIQRTSELGDTAAGKMRDTLVSIAQDIPVAFGQIAEVGELGGQLNVPAERLEAFSRSVLMFSATTNASAETAATAFGRLDALLPDVQGNYDALGSSILKVGINSVATETEIISTTSQIAAAGSMAGLTADQVIGLSASFASLGIAPEAARGTVVRVLGQMSKAIAEGGGALDEFAKISGMTAQQFSDSWGTAQFQDTFVKFLGGIQSEGKSAQLALSDLGIAAVRDQNNLLKLSQNTDIVAASFADAASGFQNSGLLADNFGIKADTLGAKLQILVNNLQALAATAGGGGMGPLKALVDGLNGMLAAATELAKNPFVSGMLSFYGAIVAVGGVALIASSSFGRLTASLLGGRVAVDFFRQATEVMGNKVMIASRALNAAGVSTDGFAGKARVAAVAASGLGTSLKAIGATTAIGAGITAAFEVVTRVMESMKSNADKAKEAIGDFGSLVDASGKDAKAAAEQYGSIDKALKDSNGSYREFKVSADTVNDVVGQAKTATAGYADAQDGLASAVANTNNVLNEQSIIVGDNMRKVLADTFMAQEGVAEAIRAINEAGINTQPLIDAIVGGDTEGARQQMAALIQQIHEANNAQGASFESASKYGEALEKINNASNIVNGALEQTTARSYLQDQVNKSLEGSTAGAGSSAQAAAAKFNEFGESVDESGQVSGSAADNIANSFDTMNQRIGNIDAFSNLLGVLQDTQGQLQLIGPNAATSVDTLMKSVEASIAAGKGMGLDAVSSVSALFTALQQKGIDTAALLQSLSSMGVTSIAGVNLGDVGKAVTGQKELSNTARVLSVQMSSLGDASSRTGSAINGASKATDDMNKSAKEAKKEVRTLTDYANDLASVWTRAFDIRFGASSSMDKIKQTFNDIRAASAKAKESIADYQQKIRELNAEQQSLASQKAVLQYFLRIAQAYNDQLRAGEIAAKLAQIDADMAKNKKDVADANKGVTDAQNEASKSLVGNSDQAIKNRQTVLGLVQEYQNYIQKLADSGASQATLDRESKRLKEEFIRQATQLGFNRGELQKYARAFDDVTVAIKNVPRNITVTANVNPAVQAMNEFKARAEAAKKAADNMNKTKITGPTVSMPDYTAMFRKMQNFSKAMEIAAQLDRMTMTYQSYIRSGSDNKAAQKLDEMNALRRQLKALGYKKGGFTGRGDPNEVAGAVHRGEFVVPHEGVDQRTGLPDVGWMMKNVLNMAPGASSGDRISNLTTINNSRSNDVQKVAVMNPVELGVQSLHALNNIGGDGGGGYTDQAIGQAASRSYVRDNQIGKY